MLDPLADERLQSGAPGCREDDAFGDIWMARVDVGDGIADDWSRARVSTTVALRAGSGMHVCVGTGSALPVAA